MADISNRKFFPAPKKDPSFVRRWTPNCKEIMKRENFKEIHLQQLEVLCDMYVEYDKLYALLEMEGYNYVTEGGRHGAQIRPRPEVGQMNILRGQIAVYTKMLGLVLVKDSETKEPEKGEWE